jgi:succinate dehydrogenase / fumarate reductase, cytochrome b subunit
MSNIFSASVGKKLLMSLAGLFLIVFLVVHLGINLLIILTDSHEPFNIAANFMTSNIVVKVLEIALFGGFLLHMFYGGLVSLQNMMARPIEYKKTNYSQISFFSKYMVHTAIVITIFLALHIFDFYIKAKFLGKVQEVIYDGKPYHDMASLVIERFKIWWVDAVYLVALLGLGFHLHHGFQSAFQTLGLNHPVYTPVIKMAGVIYTVLITIGFMSIPVVVYFFK